MPKTIIYKQDGTQAGEINLSDSIFDVKVSTSAMHKLVVNYLANQRQGTQSTKTRTEVRGGGIKPWKQKGTGRARQGSIRSPQWVGGGVALGPKPRSYRMAVNKKLRRLAMKSAFTTKLLENNLMVMESIAFDTIKTKQATEMFAKLNVDNALVVLGQNDINVVKSMSNIPNVKTCGVGTLNVYDILKYQTFIVTKDAVAQIEEVYA